MAKMLWGGAFEKTPKEAVFEHMSGENVQLDSRLIQYDILGSIAHVKMLAGQGILKKNEADEIEKALKQLYESWKEGILKSESFSKDGRRNSGERKFELKKELEDVHMNVESAVTELTPLGKKMHTARSRNDQIAVDTRLYLRDELLAVASLVVGLQKAFAKLAEKDVAMPAYTHTRVAQPITTSFWCESYVQSLERDLQRLFDAYKKANRNPLGACAISGTSLNIDRKKTALLLGFDSVLENEMDAISSRGELEAEVLFALSELMAKLSRFAEEAIWFSEMGMIKIGDEFTTGSSIMPNKKNPDVLELVRGRCGRVYGNLMHVLTVQKGLMGGHNADTQETKYAVMTGLDTAKESLAILAELIPALGFDEKKMVEEIKKGYANATELADLLAMNGIPFREAHAKLGKLVVQLAKEGKYLEDLSPEQINKLLGTNIDAKLIEKAVAVKKERLSKKVSVDSVWEKRIGEEQHSIAKAFRSL